MLVDIRHLDCPVSDALRKFTLRRLTSALRAFRDDVYRVAVRFSDVNGPRGGIDNEGSIAVRLHSVQCPVIVTGRGADAYAAILSACARLHESISRALERLARTGDPGASPSTPTPFVHLDFQPGKAAAAQDGGSEIVVTASDYTRLRALARSRRDTRDRDAAEALEDALDQAEIVAPERFASNIVAMNSRVVLKDQETGESPEVSLVYPEDSDLAQGRLSVLAPVGTALLGLAVGQTIDWRLPRQPWKRLRLIEVVPAGGGGTLGAVARDTLWPSAREACMIRTIPQVANDRLGEQTDGVPSCTSIGR